MGEVNEDAMTDPGCGRRAFCCLERDLDNLLSVDIVTVKIWSYTHPFFTPSIWRSIHQILGTPNMHHKAAFLPKDPIGSHCKSKKYETVKKMNIGSRKQNRNRRRGAWSPSGSAGIGRKGAMPEPVGENLSIMEKDPRSAVNIDLPRSRNWENFSIATSAVARGWESVSFRWNGLLHVRCT